MPSTFSRTLRALEADGHRPALWVLGLVIALLILGGAWFFFGRVAIYETTDRARLEVERAAHPVAVPVAGRVVASHLSLGRKVEIGDLLLELENESERLQLEEEKQRLASVQHRLEALHTQLAAEDRAWPEEKKAGSLAIDEARARQNEAEAAAKFAEAELDRIKRLGQAGVLSQADLERAQAEAQKQRAAAAAQSLTAIRLESELAAKDKGHAVRLATLQREVATLQGDLDTAQATIKRHEFLIDQRRVRAPVAGELGEISELQPGAFLSEGQKIGAIIPEGELKLVAQFPPLTASGRVRTGQPARLRLAAFPWAQYGSLAATVTGVAQEPLDGQLRVELTIKPSSVPRIPVQHGLLGSLEVQVDHLSPATLILRAAGKLLSVGREPGVSGGSAQP